MDILLIRGDDLIINGEVKDKTTKNPINLTGSTIKYGLNKTQTRNPFLFGNATIISNINGTYKIHISNIETSKLAIGIYFLDIQLTDSQGIISTIGQFRVNVTYDIIQ